jgi:transcriptional regulator with XRE-family HTH domain
MTLADKLKDLRVREGRDRGLNRPLTQSEVSRLIRAETGRGLTQAYLSQLESGKRRHLTADTREQLAQFFTVHPGYLVDDLPGPRRRGVKSGLSEWLQAGHDQMERIDPPLAGLLQDLASDKNPRRYFDLLESLLRDKEGLRKLLKEKGIS